MSRDASSIVIPKGRSISLFNKTNYEGSCISATAPPDKRRILNLPSSHDNRLKSIRIDETCYKGRVYCYEQCDNSGGNCDWCGIGHKCCRMGYSEGGECPGGWESNSGNLVDHVCIRTWD